LSAPSAPVKAPTLELRYDLDQSEFHSSSTGYIATSPELGFLYPAFDNRTANIYNVLFYSKNAAEIHQEVIDALFHVDPPMSAEEQKNAFGSALADALDKDCSYDVVQSVHEQIRARIEDHKEGKDPEPLEMTAGDVGGILANSGVNDEQIAAFQRECDEQHGENAALNPNNIIESKKFEITTPEVKISIAPENSYMIEARVINGRKSSSSPRRRRGGQRHRREHPGSCKRGIKTEKKPHASLLLLFDLLYALLLVEVQSSDGRRTLRCRVRRRMSSVMVVFERVHPTSSCLRVERW